jgi:diaminohydroxyphosphoribosylaminopyrimidine deaminase / 5-amino-6-(5-phosphoribosylamino)uracil reductase
MPDKRWMAGAIALAARGRAHTQPNPNVGCIIVKDGRVIGRGWTQPGGRPHAEAMALAQAGADARGATVFVTLEPCIHDSDRGPSCAVSLAAAGVAAVVIACQDPDPRTNGNGIKYLINNDIIIRGDVMAPEARNVMAGWLKQTLQHRPYITLKLATSLDGCIARADGESKWITGDAARAHAHLERVRSNAILVGRGTYDADAPRLDVRLAGLERFAPQRIMLTKGEAPDGWTAIGKPEDVANLHNVQYLLVEGGAQTAAAFLKAGLVDRLMLYRAPIMIGAGRASLGDIGLDALEQAHGQWRRSDKRTLGSDTLDVYERV